MLALLPLLLLAQDTATPPANPDIEVEGSRGRVQTFIAPSGEPFHSYGGQPYPVAKWFAQADTNGDGKLDAAEFEADFLRFFDSLDLNHDGAVDGIEREKYENDVAPETLGGAFDYIEGSDQDDDDDGDGTFARRDQDVHTTPDRTKPAYGTHPVGAARYDLLGIPEPVAAMDVQIRGRISHNAAIEAAKLRFSLLDSQHRGYLTLDTLPYTFVQHRGLVVGGSGKKRKR